LNKYLHDMVYQSTAVLLAGQEASFAGAGLTLAGADWFAGGIGYV